LAKVERKKQRPAQSAASSNLRSLGKIRQKKRWVPSLISSITFRFWECTCTFCRCVLVSGSHTFSPKSAWFLVYSFLTALKNT